MGMSIYDVIVGNIGTVETTHLWGDALEVFAEYKRQSAGGYGRAAGEDVTVMRDGEIWKEYIGTAG